MIYVCLDVMPYGSIKKRLEGCMRSCRFASVMVVFPWFDGGLCCIWQGGPHEHAIAAIAVTMQQAMRPEFKEYQLQVDIYLFFAGLIRRHRMIFMSLKAPGGATLLFGTPWTEYTAARVISQGKNPLKYSAVVWNWTRARGRTDSEIHSFSHWAIPLSYPTELSHWAIPLSYPTELSHWAIPLSLGLDAQRIRVSGVLL